MTTIEIYPGRKKREEKTLALFEKAPISPKNKTLIRAFQNSLYAKGSTGSARLAKLTIQLARIAADMAVDFDKATKKHAETLIASYNRSTAWSDATKADYRRAFKQFYWWFEEEDERLRNGDEMAREFYRYLKKPGNIVTSYKERQIDYGEVITEDDLALLIDKGAANTKEKAFLAVLHEGGLRIGEMLHLRLCDLETSQNSILLSVEGKTGKRRVPIAWAMGRLTRWLEEHPRKNEPNAPLWTSNNSSRMHEPLLYPGAYKLLKRCYARSGLKKRFNPHWFRHSRASVYTAAGMNESTLKLCGGWTPGSRQLKRYVHINAKTVQDAVLRINGLQSVEETRKLPVKCQTCQLTNDPGTRYCSRCGRPMNVAVMLEDEPKKNAAIDEAMQAFARIMADPEMRTRFEAFRSKQ